MTKIPVNKEILRWAIKRFGVPLGVLEKKFPKLRQWIEGREYPTLKQLEKLAKATLTPLGYFFLSEPPDERLPIPHYRTMADDSDLRPSPDLIETVQIMERRQVWMREFLLEEKEQPLEFVGSVNIDKNSNDIANNIRSNLGFREEWAAQYSTWESALLNLRKTIEKIGILVVVNGVVGNNTHRKLDPTEFRGFVLVDEYAPLVFVNGADSKAAQMFTLAHELAHLWFGKGAAFDLREMFPADDPIEQACNKVAAEFLIPEIRLHQIWKTISKEPEPFQALARRFKVSEIVVARRVLDLQLIKKSEFLDFYRIYKEKVPRISLKKQSGGDYYLNQNARIGQRFAHAIIQAVKEGNLLYREAYQLTGLHGKTFEGYSEFLGYGRII